MWSFWRFAAARRSRSLAPECLAGCGAHPSLRLRNATASGAAAAAMFGCHLKGAKGAEWCAVGADGDLAGVSGPDLRLVPGANEPHKEPDGRGGIATLRRAPSAKQATTRLFVIRHGESAWNAESRIQGQIDVPLNEAGRNQAWRAAEALQALGIANQVDAVVSSDLARASVTADIIASVCHGAPRVTDAGLREINFGTLQGQMASSASAKEIRKKVMSSWMRGDFSHAFPGGGESGEEVVGRGLKSLQAASELGACVIVVAHGGLIKWSGTRIELGEESPSPESMASPHLAEFIASPVQNCCCSTVVFDHAAKRFHAESWFKVLSAGTALDDSG